MNGGIYYILRETYALSFTLTALVSFGIPMCLLPTGKLPAGHTTVFSLGKGSQVHFKTFQRVTRYYAIR